MAVGASRWVHGEDSRSFPRWKTDKKTDRQAARLPVNIAAQELRFPFNSHVFFYVFFFFFNSASSFIAPLLWEREPRRLFNIISSSQYIIPQQILVYLQTRLKYMERARAAVESEEEGGALARPPASSCQEREREEEQERTYVVGPLVFIRLSQ